MTLTVRFRCEHEPVVTSTRPPTKCPECGAPRKSLEIPSPSVSGVARLVSR